VREPWATPCHSRARRSASMDRTATVEPTTAFRSDEYGLPQFLRGEGWEERSRPARSYWFSYWFRTEFETASQSQSQSQSQSRFRRDAKPTPRRTPNGGLLLWDRLGLCPEQFPMHFHFHRRATMTRFLDSRFQIKTYRRRRCAVVAVGNPLAGFPSVGGQPGATRLVQRHNDTSRGAGCPRLSTDAAASTASRRAQRTEAPSDRKQSTGADRHAKTQGYSGNARHVCRSSWRSAGSGVDISHGYERHEPRLPVICVETRQKWH